MYPKPSYPPGLLVHLEVGIRRAFILKFRKFVVFLHLQFFSAALFSKFLVDKKKAFLEMYHTSSNRILRQMTVLNWIFFIYGRFVVIILVSNFLVAAINNIFSLFFYLRRAYSLKATDNTHLCFPASLSFLRKTCGLCY
jgi:hypothetical protein